MKFPLLAKDARNGASTWIEEECGEKSLIRSCVVVEMPFVNLVRIGYRDPSTAHLLALRLSKYFAQDDNVGMERVSCVKFSFRILSL